MPLSIFVFDNPILQERAEAGAMELKKKQAEESIAIWNNLEY